MKPLYLRFVNTGVANRFDFDDYDLIEMNWRLKLYPKLFYGVLMHELEHEDNTHFEDLKIDMRAKTPGLFRFMSRHISAWTQILPFYYDVRKNKIVYDVSYIVSWIMILSLATSTFFFLRWLL